MFLNNIATLPPNYSFYKKMKLLFFTLFFFNFLAFHLESVPVVGGSSKLAPRSNTATSKTVETVQSSTEKPIKGDPLDVNNNGVKVRRDLK